MFITKKAAAIAILVALIITLGGFGTASADDSSRKPSEGNIFNVEKETSYLLYRVIDNEQATLHSVAAIYKVFSSDNNAQKETTSPWTKKFWKDKIEVKNLLFRKEAVSE